MKSIVAAVLIAATVTTAAADSGSNFRAVRGTPEMNYKMDRVTPGVTPIGAKAPNDDRRAKCEQITANFGYPDGSVKRQTMTRCD
jgi:hypothetical protein